MTWVSRSSFLRAARRSFDTPVALLFSAFPEDTVTVSLLPRLKVLEDLQAPWRAPQCCAARPSRPRAMPPAAKRRRLTGKQPDPEWRLVAAHALPGAATGWERQLEQVSSAAAYEVTELLQLGPLGELLVRDRILGVLRWALSWDQVTQASSRLKPPDTHGGLSAGRGHRGVRGGARPGTPAPQLGRRSTRRGPREPAQPRGSSAQRAPRAAER